MFDDYLVLGGFPALKYFGLERSPSIQYLQSVLDTVIVRDVIEHHQVRDVDLFRRLIRYCIGNIGRTFSARSVVRHLKSEGRAVSVDTVLNHLDFCIGAHLIARVPRRDVAGKSILRSDEKYYAVDHGLRTAMGFDNLSDVEIVLENIVHTELTVSRVVLTAVSKPIVSSVPATSLSMVPGIPMTGIPMSCSSLAP